MNYDQKLLEREERLAKAYKRDELSEAQRRFVEINASVIEKQYKFSQSINLNDPDIDEAITTARDALQNVIDTIHNKRSDHDGDK